MAKTKTNKHLSELFEMWNQEHLDNIALSQKIIELKLENANLKKQIYENHSNNNHKARNSRGD